MTLLIVLVVLIIAGFILFPEAFGKLRIIAKGFMGLFVRNIAETPEGARAIYEEAIDKAQKKYNQASDALAQAAGQYKEAEDNLKATSARLAEVESGAERLAAGQRFDQVQILAEEREQLLKDKSMYEQALGELQPIVDESKEIMQFCEKELVRLKREQVTVVSNLERNIRVKEMMDQMDQLKRNTNLDQMLGMVKEGAAKKKQMAEGARVVHESRRSTQVARVEADLAGSAAASYVEQLRAKHQKVQG